MIEIARRLSVFRMIAAMGATARRTGRILRIRRASETRKERAIHLVSRRMFVLSARFGGVLAAVAAPLGIAAGVAVLAGIDPVAVATDWRMRCALIVVGLGYAISRTLVTRRLSPRR